MSIDIIYLDLDDVLTRFVPFALQFVTGKKVSYSTYPNTGWDIVAAANKISGGDLTPERFWNYLNEDFWANLPKTEFADDLVSASIRAVGPESVFIATSTTFSPGCVAGKLRWLQQNLPTCLQRQYFFTPRKEMLGREGALLIDDRERNCERFVQMGGEAILVSRPWNCMQGEATSDTLRQAFHEVTRVRPWN